MCDYKESTYIHCLLLLMLVSSHCPIGNYGDRYFGTVHED